METYFPYEPDRDDRYLAKFFDGELLRALGRLTLNASGLENTVATVLWRLLDNGDLDLGKRVTADAGFSWLIDHTRAVSHHRLSASLHDEVATWLKRARAAYDARNRIVHSQAAPTFTSADDELRVSVVWMRSSARRAVFSEDVRPATAQDVHDAAIELEQASLAGVMLMARVTDALSGTVGQSEGSSS